MTEIFTLGLCYILLLIFPVTYIISFIVPGLPKPVALPPSVPKVDVDNKENTKPEEPETNSVDINNELGGVIGQLSEFKAELLHLHSVVCVLPVLLLYWDLSATACSRDQ